MVLPTAFNRDQVRFLVSDNSSALFTVHPKTWEFFQPPKPGDRVTPSRRNFNVLTAWHRQQLIHKTPAEAQKATSCPVSSTAQPCITSKETTERILEVAVSCAVMAGIVAVLCFCLRYRCRVPSKGARRPPRNNLNGVCDGSLSTIVGAIAGQQLTFLVR